MSCRRSRAESRAPCSKRARSGTNGAGTASAHGSGSGAKNGGVGAAGSCAVETAAGATGGGAAAVSPPSREAHIIVSTATTPSDTKSVPSAAIQPSARRRERWRIEVTTALVLGDDAEIGGTWSADAEASAGRPITTGEGAAGATGGSTSSQTS